MGLTNTQVEEWREHGVLAVENLLSAVEMDPVIDEINDYVERRARELKDAGKIDNLYEDEPFERRYGRIFSECPDIGRGIDIMHLRGPAMFEFLHNKTILDAVESLIGPEIICSPVQHLRAKPPTHLRDAAPELDEVIPWHQDAGVIWEEADQSNIVTVWLPLVDATIENGCLEVMPDAWRHGYLEHSFQGRTSIEPAAMPSLPSRPLPIRKGGVIFMNKFTPHRSTPNLRDIVRWSIDLRYQPTGTPTGRPFQPSFVVRSRQDPASVLTDHATWCRLWIEGLEVSKGIKSQRRSALVAGGANKP